MSAEQARTPVPLTLFVPMFEDFEAESRDAQNHWFDTDHVPQRLTIPGFRKAVRYERSDVRVPDVPPAPLRYLNAYEIDGPKVVSSEAYAASFAHRTPRTTREDFVMATPRYRDVWQQAPSAWEGDTRLEVRGTQAILLVAATSRDEAAAREFLDARAIPNLLSCPGLLSARRFERLDLEIAAASSDHAPRFMIAFILASAEAVTRPDLVRLSAQFAGCTAASGASLITAWTGVYCRRPSPWTVRPVAVR